MKAKIPMIIVCAAFSAAAFAVAEEYPVVIESSQSLDTFSANTKITNNSTLSITTTANKNWSVWIDAGSTLAYTATNDAFKWGTGTNSHKTAIVETYGTIDMQSNKAFRFGDDGGGYSTTLNLYDGALMTSSTGTFGIENFRGTYSGINVYTGAAITNLNGITTWGRNNESAAEPLFEVNVLGGSVSVSGDVSFGNNSNSNSETIQTSKINVSNGGTFTTTGRLLLGNAARNNSEINVSGEGSVLSVNGVINASRAADTETVFTVSDGGKLESKADVSLAAASGADAVFNVNDGGVWSITNGTLYVGYSSDSTATVNVNGGVISQDSSAARTLVFGQGTSSEANLNITNGGRFVEENQVFNIYMGHVSNSVFNGSISGSKTSGGDTVASSLNVSGTLTLGSGGDSVSTLNVSNGGELSLLRSAALAEKLGADSNGNMTLGAANGAVVNVNIKNGGTFYMGNQVLIGGGADTTATFTVEQGGVYNVTKASELRIGTASGAVGTLKLDGGTLNMDGTSDLNIHLGYSTGAETSKIVMVNDARVQQSATGKNIQLNMWNGENELSLKNSVWYANTNFYVGRGADSVSTLNVDNSIITDKNGSLTGYSSDLYTGAGADTTSYVFITKGSVVNLRGLNVSQGHASNSTTAVGGENAKSYFTVSGNGTVFAVRSANNTNYHNRWGVNADSAAYEGNVANMSIYTGAQFLNSQNAIQIFDSAQISFVLDSKGIPYAETNSVAMMKTPRLEVTMSDGTVSKAFAVDGASLSYIAGAEKGDVYKVALINTTTSFSLNGSILDFAAMSQDEFISTVSGMFDFRNNTNLVDWEDFDANDIKYESNCLNLYLTYVPEPSTYAVIISMLALAIAIYRRRK